jgi:DNA-binding response OmpR family regulator
MLTRRHRDRVLGLELGADDYLPNPSIRRNSRRRPCRSAPGQARGGSGIVLGDVSIGGDRTVYRNGESTGFDHREFDILAALSYSGRGCQGAARTGLGALGREFSPFQIQLSTPRL